MERLTEKTVGCFEYALKDHKAVPGEFGTYDAFFFFSMAVKRLGHYEDTGLEPEQVMELKSFTQGGIHKVDNGWKHVQDLLQAEQDGRLVVLPCKVGDTVWLLKKKCKYAGEDNDPWCSCDQYWDNVYHKHMWGCAGKDDEGKQFDCEKRDMEWYAQQIEYSLVLYSPNIVLGKNLFLTREEAEAALKGGEG